MEMKIGTIPVYTVAYIRQTGPYGEGNKQTMEMLKSLAASNGLLNDESIILGIAQDDPVKTKPENCRYDACLVVTSDSSMHDASLNYGTVAGGKYAVYTIEHTPEAMQQAWNEVFTDLLRRGCQIDSTKPIIERYAAQILKQHKCEICLPVY